MEQTMDARLEQFDLATPQRRKTISDLATILMPHLDEVLDRFYQTAMADAKMRGFFRDESQAGMARTKQKKHWQLLLKGDFSDAYQQSAKTIGQVHFAIQLPFDYYLASYSRIASHIQSILFQKTGRLASKDILSEQVAVLYRLFALDTEIVISAFYEAKQNEIECAMRHLSQGIESLERGELGVTIAAPEDSDFPKAFDDLRNSFNKASYSLSQTMTRVSDNVTLLNDISHRLGDGAEDLANRTAHQASALEQAAAALQEMTESVATSSEKADKTSKIVRDSGKAAEEQGQTVKDAVAAMHAVEESFNEIAKIMKVIDDISFQTNLLALNAGVEAARAGEAGRGFAVVASEVRNLAVRASQAAGEINSLISKSSNHVGQGVTLVDRTGEALAKIVEQIGEVTKHVADMSSTTQEQARGLREINSAVNELDTNTQQNAQSAKNTRDNCAEILTAMAQLREQLAQFSQHDATPSAARAA